MHLDNLPLRSAASRQWPFKVAAYLGRAWRARPLARRADAAHADVLVRALLQGLPTYPADGSFDAADELVIDDTVAARRYVFPLGPGRTTWLHRLVAAELATHRNARPGGNGQCEHCHGSGLAAPF
ncbi:hypothetical protein [Nonomuraea sp. NPDC050786]|uniref:hypothetical protein n=1 Tax=Nonomuraea sp. NPDC050786 TaxID=3154840 RepID=UPI0033E50242